MEKLKLELTLVSPFRVYIGNGDYLLCRHVSHKVPVEMQGKIFPIDLHVLAVEGPSVVLGVQWLQTLGRVCHDCDELTMEFKWQGRVVQLRGNKHSRNRAITFIQLQAMVKAEEVEEIYEIYAYPAGDKNKKGEFMNIERQEGNYPQNLPPDIQGLVQ